MLYKPGDTRMMSVFKEIFRTSALQGPICALFGDGKYKTMAQKIMESYNRTCKDPSKKFKKRARSSVFVDDLDDAFGHDSFTIWTQMELWLQVNVALVFSFALWTLTALRCTWFTIAGALWTSNFDA